MKKLFLVLILCLIVLISSCAVSGGDESVSSGKEPEQDSAENIRPSEDKEPTDNSGLSDDALPADPDGENGSADTSDESADVSSDAESGSPDGDTSDEDTENAQSPEEPDDTYDPELQLLAPNGIPAVHITTAPDATITRSEYIDCEIAVADPTGTYGIVSDAESTIKVRGHSSSQGAKKPYNFKFSSKQELLGLGKGKKWALLSNMYDKTQLRNLLAFGFANDIGMPYIQQSTVVEVYLNGEYRGIYQLCEPVDVDETKVDIDKDGNEALLEIEPRPGYSNDNWIYSPRYSLLLGFNEPEEPTDEQRAYYKEFLGTAEAAMASGDYAELCKYVDVESFANAYIVQELFKQVDYTTTSTRFYIKEDKLYEGPVWDFDLSSGNCSSSLYPEYNNKGTTGLSWQGIHCVGLWNKYLFKYDEFKQLVSDRLTELQPIIINLFEDNELGRSRIDAWLDEYRDDIDRNNGLWSTAIKYNSYEHSPVDGTYDGEIEFLRDWLKNRNQWLLDYYCVDEQQ